MKKFIMKNAKILSMLALSVAVLNSNQVCWVLIHQPEVPEKVKKLRKF